MRNDNMKLRDLTADPDDKMPRRFKEIPTEFVKS